MLKVNNDIELLRGLRKGEEKAFRYLFDYYYNAIKNNIRQFIFDSTKAEDILQEVFISLWEQRMSLPEDLRIESWLFSVSYKKSISYLRKKSNIPFSELSIDENKDFVNADDEALNNEIHYLVKLDTLKSGINKLSPQTKKAFILYKIKNKSYEDISEEMGITVLSAKQYVKMAMKFLKKYVGVHSIELSVLSYVILNSKL